MTRDGEILPEDKLPQGFNILSISDGRSYEVGLLLWMINNYASLDLCFNSCLRKSAFNFSTSQNDIFNFAFEQDVPQKNNSCVYDDHRRKFVANFVFCIHQVHLTNMYIVNIAL